MRLAATTCTTKSHNTYGSARPIVIEVAFYNYIATHDQQKTAVCGAEYASLSLGSTFRIVCLNFNFDTHIVLAQALHANTSVQGLVVGHPMLEIPQHVLSHLTVVRDVVGTDLVHLRPALSASGLQGSVHVPKSLLDLRTNVAVDGLNWALLLPSTYCFASR